MGSAQLCAIAYAVQTWSFTEAQDETSGYTCSVIALQSSPLSFLMSSQSPSSNPSRGSDMTRFIVSRVPCLVRKTAISWYACNITCMINKAQFQQNLDKARFGPSAVFLRLQGILRVQRTDGLTTFVWECIVHSSVQCTIPYLQV